MQLSKKKKDFLNFFCIFKICIRLYTLAKKKMTLIADVFLGIPAPKSMVGLMSKKPRFTGPLDREHDKWAETMFQSE